MSEPPVIVLRLKPGKPSVSERAMVDHRWRVGHLMLAPHRLGFFLAMLVLVVAAGW